MSIPIVANLIYVSFFRTLCDSISVQYEVYCSNTMTSLVETFCYESLVGGASWSRLNEAVLAGTHDRLSSRAKNGYHRFFFAVYHRGSRGFECYMCVVVILDSSGRLTAWSTLRSVFSITGTSPYKGYPGLAPII